MSNFPVNRHLSSSFSTKNSAAINILINIPKYIYARGSLRYIPMRKNTGSWSLIIFNLVSSCQIVFQDGGIYSHPHQQNVSADPHVHPYVVLTDSLIFADLVDLKEYLAQSGINPHLMFIRLYWDFMSTSPTSLLFSPIFC